jgi:hypothetical protein
MYHHPGGFDRIEPFLGKNIDKTIAGHTAAALKIIAQLPQIGMLEGA